MPGQWHSRFIECIRWGIERSQTDDCVFECHLTSTSVSLRNCECSNIQGSIRTDVRQTTRLNRTKIGFRQRPLIASTIPVQPCVPPCTFTAAPQKAQNRNLFQTATLRHTSRRNSQGNIAAYSDCEETRAPISPPSEGPLQS